MGCVHVYCGDGKGKTSAALGLALLTGCAPAGEAASSQVEPITQESEAPSLLRS